MPLWNIYHSAGLFSEDDKKGIAQAIVPLYPILPKFYVGVVFHEVPKGALFIGGVRNDGFVRIAVDHIARQFPNDEVRQRWLGMCKDALAPYTAGRGLDWEMHVDETPFQLWLIQGMGPPLPNSEDEKLWIAENRPVPYAVTA